MIRVRHLLQIAASTLLLLATACARHGVGHESAEAKSVTESSSSAPVPPSLSGPVVQRHAIETEDFTLPLPHGYDDVTDVFRQRAPRLSVVLQARTSFHGSQATIVVQKVPLPGGSFDDPSECARTGNGLITGGTEAPGTGGTLLSAAIIEGPVGKTCQIHLRAPEGMALITELHRPGNTVFTPKDIWLMTCNHSDGDEGAEATCRATLAGFRFRAR